jgi:Flp pilus assembly protein TadG
VNVCETVMHMRTRLIKNERGVALIEAAATIPLILMVAVGIFEFGRAYQTWQVVTNAAREGARVAVISGTTDDQVREAVRAYMTVGRLEFAATAPIDVVRNAPFGGPTSTWTASSITVNYPFEFIMLNPIVRLVVPASTTGAPITMSAVATMRNEG